MTGNVAKRSESLSGCIPRSLLRASGLLPCCPNTPQLAAGIFYSEAIKSRSRDIELGGSLRAWLTRLGIPQGGSSMAAVRDQAERLSLCRLTFRVRAAGVTGLLNQSIVDTALFADEPDGAPGKRKQFTERV